MYFLRIFSFTVYDFNFQTYRYPSKLFFQHSSRKTRVQRSDKIGEIHQAFGNGVVAAYSASSTSLEHRLVQAASGCAPSVEV